MMRRYVFAILLAAIAALMLPQPATAKWTSIAPGKAEIADGKLVADAPKGWSRSSARPVENSEIWTRDGPALNEISFFGGLSNGSYLYGFYAFGGTDMPKFRKEMLLTDLVEFFEASNRQSLQTAVFEIGTTEPATLAGHDAVRFSYEYAVQQDSLRRKGEAVASVIDGKLYLINYVAPSLYFFDRDLPAFREIVKSLRIADGDGTQQDTDAAAAAEAADVMMVATPARTISAASRRRPN